MKIPRGCACFPLSQSSSLIFGVGGSDRPAFRSQESAPLPRLLREKAFFERAARRDQVRHSRSEASSPTSVGVNFLKVAGCKSANAASLKPLCNRTSGRRPPQPQDIVAALYRPKLVSLETDFKGATGGI